MSVIDIRPLTRTERRRQATRQRILEAAFAVISEVGYDDFSIRQVTERADVGYGTFYSYFDNRDDLIWQILVIHMDAIQQQTTQIIAELDSPQREIASWEFFFENAKNTREDYLKLFGAEGRPQLRVALENYTAEVYEGNLRAENFTIPPAYEQLPVTYLAHFMAGAQMQLVNWWLQSDMSYTSEEMARMLYRTIFHCDPEDGA